MTETWAEANQAFDALVETYQDKYPKVVEILSKDREELMAFCDFSVRSWQSIRTTNPINADKNVMPTTHSKECLNRNSMLCMLFKLGQCAEKKWRELRGFRQLGK